MRLVLAVAAWAALSLTASAQEAPAPERIQRGALVLENIPDAPPEVSERLRQYVNTRNAVMTDWLPSGGVLVLTRFGDTAQLHRVDEPLGARTQLTFFDERVTDGQVRPGAPNLVLFTRDVGGNENYGGYLLDTASGRSIEFTEPNTRNQFFIWSDDGALAAWSLAPAEEPDYDVYVGDPSNPDSRRVVHEGEGAIGPLDFSADGSKLLLQRYVSIAESRLFVLDIASGVATQLAPDISVAYDDGVFTPDGRAVIVSSDEDSQFLRLVRIDLESGARTVLTPDVQWDVEAFDLSDDGRTLAYALNEAGQSRLHLMDLRTRRALPAPNLPPGVLHTLSFDASGQNIGLTLNRATASADVYSYDLRRRELTRWTQSETGGIPESVFVEPSLISWPSFDGRDITGFLYTPRTPGPHPVIINIHGGPESQARPGFNSTIQYWVNELGVAVIQPNVRGSAGYGRDFLALDNGVNREDSVRDIGALLDWVYQRADLDSNRMVVYGGSYGGYMVLASMTHYNDRLAGAVDIVGISNFVSFLENTSGYRRDLRRAEYGDERDPAMREHLQSISPLTNAARITKPMLVIHGYNDPRVPVTETEQLLETVRANGGEVWLMLAMNEGHGFARRENQEAQREAETMFFRRVLELE